MKITFHKDFEKRKGVFLIIPYWEGGKRAFHKKVDFKEIDECLDQKSFQGKLSETFLLHSSGMRILLIGLGKKTDSSLDSVRLAMSAAIKASQAKKIEHIHLFMVDGDFSEAVFEGIFLANYAYTKLKGKSETPVLCKHLTVVGDPKLEKKADRIFKIIEGTHFVRDLVHGNADDVNPEYLVKLAKGFSKDGIKVAVLDQKKLEEEKLGLLLAVGQGARYAPSLIMASYRGAASSKEHILLVGKGVTYDTGGLCLKSADNMLTMKCDMAGAATVLAAVKTAAALKLKVNVTAVAPVAENAIGSKSYKTGDVIRSISGKTVEVVNTDAEGRLILADAIAYGVKHLNPSKIIDIGTLTGAIVIALGEEIAGLFTDSDPIAKDLKKASEQTGEKLWRLPLHDYREALKSDIGDIANLGGRDAGSMKCALFLQEFTDGIPWAHIDMAGPAYLSKPKGYNPTKATGWGHRLLVEYLEMQE